MRILKFFLLALIWISIIGTIVFLIGREVILFWGVNALIRDYTALSRKNYAKWCVDQFAYSQEYATQIRFISNKEYNLEVVCADFIASPILIEKKSLFPLLVKTSFGSGFVIDEHKRPFFVELAILGRNVRVYAEDSQIHFSYLSIPDLDYDQGPVSACQSHNYQCCSLDLQSGLGQQFNLVNDCPKSCYESCLLRPVFLSFNSNPQLQEAERLVELLNGDTLTLSYVLGNGKGDVFSGQIDKNASTSLIERLQTIFFGQTVTQIEGQITLPVTIKIDFGDGKTWESTNLQDSVDHIYKCQTQTCYFQVQIFAQDAKGVLSVDNEATKMIIKVHR